MAKINLHIDRLVLDGIDVPHRHRPLLQAAVETELARLLAAEGLAPGLSAGGALRGLQGGTVQLGEGGDPAGLGRQIAQAVYGGIGE